MSQRHNESQAEKAPEYTKPSKAARIKSVALTTGVTLIPVVLTVAPLVFGARIGRMNFETARLNLETARINHPGT